MKLLVATGNQHKLREISQILTPLGIEIMGSKEVGGIPDVIEDGTTFYENAAKKAQEVAQAKGVFCLADDSGLMVDALNGLPGVYSARYAGEHGNDAANRLKLLEVMKKESNRKARFACAIAIAAPDGTIVASSYGEVLGKIIDQERGNGGFGYDPIFVPDGFDQTFAELSEEIKNSLSHRFNALNQLVENQQLKEITSY